MKNANRDRELDELIDEITTDANGEAEQLWAFRQAFEDNVAVPCEASVVGQSVQVLRFDYAGNERRGLTVVCRRADGTKHVVAASELAIPPSAQGGRYLAAYRKWMGIAPSPPSTRRATGRKTAAPAASVEGPVELVVLSVKQKAARCHLLGSDQTFTFRAGRIWDLVPGEIATVKPAKQWTYAGNPYLSGAIESTRLDAKSLGLVPLGLEQVGIWNPAEHYWGEEGDPIEDWAKPVIARGPRPEFEMEQVLPGLDVEDPDSDPIGQSNDSKDSGDLDGAYKMLMDLCQADLRCLDAHSHLGNFVFDHRPKDAIRHYEVGFRIGELSLGESFDDVLPWGWIGLGWVRLFRVLLGQRPSLHDLLRPSPVFVRPLRGYYAAVRLTFAVRVGLMAHRFLPPIRPLLAANGYRVSRFSRVKFPCMPGVYDSAEPVTHWRKVARHSVAFGFA